MNRNQQSLLNILRNLRQSRDCAAQQHSYWAYPNLNNITAHQQCNFAKNCFQLHKNQKYHQNLYGLCSINRNHSLAMQHRTNRPRIDQQRRHISTLIPLKQQSYEIKNIFQSLKLSRIYDFTSGSIAEARRQYSNRGSSPKNKKSPIPLTLAGADQIVKRVQGTYEAYDIQEHADACEAVLNKLEKKYGRLQLGVADTRMVEYVPVLRKKRSDPLHELSVVQVLNAETLLVECYDKDDRKLIVDALRRKEFQPEIPTEDNVDGTKILVPVLLPTKEKADAMAKECFALKSEHADMLGTTVKVKMQKGYKKQVTSKQDQVACEQVVEIYMNVYKEKLNKMFEDKIKELHSRVV